MRAVATTLKPLKPLIKRKLINVYRNQVNSWKIFKKILSFYFQSAYQVTMSNMKVYKFSLCVDLDYLDIDMDLQVINPTRRAS